MRLGFVAALSVSLLVGCSHKKEYAAAQARYHDPIGSVANWAPLLDAASYGNADKRAVIPAAQHGALVHLCTIAQGQTFVADELNDVEKRVEAAFEMVQKGCCDSAQTSAIATATSCADAVRRESATLETIFAVDG